MINIESLWGDDFVISNDYDKVKQIISKAKNPKSVKALTPEKILKSKTATFEEKLVVTQDNVYKILGHYTEDTRVIYDRNEFHDYITAAIKNGIISIDTETLGTRTDIPKPATDPFTCRIAGLCLYTPGQKQTYIPINHIDYKTDKRLENQLTENDIKEELARLVDAETFNIYHNGKFDYMVLNYTCDVKVPISWDTMIGAQILNENERAGLKFQYRDKIDPNQEKYDIDKLFDLNHTEKYPVELFALYAATDSYITYKLYKYQLDEFSKPGNERLYNLFKNIEMPVVMVTTGMEMRGLSVDKEFAQRLSIKFHKRLDALNKTIEEEMNKYSDVIKQWRLSPIANSAPVNSKGKKQKSLSEKLADPVELTSPTQLGILLYDVLHVLKVGRDGKKVTDEATLLEIKDKLPLAEMILKKREYEKYLGTYIDVLPTYCSPRDGRLHAKFNQLGREESNVVTGRMSSSDPNLQNVPSRGDIISVRCMFKSTVEYPEFLPLNNQYIIPIENEIELITGEYKWSSELKPGDTIYDGRIIDQINIKDNQVIIIFNNFN